MDWKTNIKTAINVLYVLSILSMVHFIAFQLVIDGIVLQYLAYSLPETADSLAMLASFMPLHAIAIPVFIIIYFTKDIVNKW